MAWTAASILRIRCRLRPSFAGIRFASSYLRLADRAHRQLYNSLQTEMKRYRNGKALKVKPSLPQFFVWLQKYGNNETVTLGEAHIPAPFSKESVLEVGLFHLLIGLKGLPDLDWQWETQIEHLDLIQKRMGSNKKFASVLDSSLADAKHILLQESNILHVSGSQLAVIEKSLAIVCAACPQVYKDTSLTLITWLRSLFASSVTDAERHLREATYIPPCIYSDILLRTSMSRKELHDQLSLWHDSIALIGRHYNKKSSHITTIMTNLSYYCVHYDHSCLYDFTKHNLKYFTSKNSGFNFKLFDPAQINKLLWTLSVILIHTQQPSNQTAMAVIRSQELLVKYLTHGKLSQVGFMAVIIALRYVSDEKAQKLFKYAKSQFPDVSVEAYMAEVYLSNSPEQLLHSFNVAMSDYESSATLWLAFVTKLTELGLLSEQRSLKVLDQLLPRSKDLIISKQIILTLLHPIRTIQAMEEFISKLESANMFQPFKGIVHNRYLQILYQNSDTIPASRPYLETVCNSQSAVECARQLYSCIDRKTVNNIGVMLAGESTQRAEDLYNLYQQELGTTPPDENCLVALLRAASWNSTEEHRLRWNNLHATQVAVYEFKLNVSEAFNDSKIMPSNKTWQLYITLLKDCDYTSELSEILRWWEQLHFVPSRDTLLTLLQALPLPFAQRHIKHWKSVPDSASSLQDWPWPNEEELQN